jgi:cation-transporting ATPase E
LPSQWASCGWPSQRCLVQELPAIEVLARVDVLCADKTGTITEGALAREQWPSSWSSIDHHDAAAQVDAALAALAQLDPDPNATSKSRSTSTSCRRPPPGSVIGRVPFSSGSQVERDELRRPGRVEGQLDPGRTRERDDHRLRRGDLQQQVEAHASHSASRVLVLATTESTVRRRCGRRRCPGVHPVALVLLEDIVRADAPATLQYFADQGVTVKVISGDNNVTVGAVARRAGMAGWENNVNATTLPPDDSPEFAAAIEQGVVFGRVTPHQKRAMVKALQANGHTVAMTGDGVNDVLALKDSDCGVAMASGSEATRGVAQLVLMDSNFSAMPAVVGEGRRVINNIERVASLFLAKTTYSVVLSVLTGVFALAYPLRPIHLSILSWFTIGVPAFFLALEPNDSRVSTGFLRRVLGKAVPAGLVIAGCPPDEPPARCAGGHDDGRLRFRIPDALEPRPVRATAHRTVGAPDGVRVRGRGVAAAGAGQSHRRALAPPRRLITRPRTRPGVHP